MYRSVTSLFLLILLVGSLIVMNPQALAEATQLWDETRPTLLAWKDRALQVVYDLLSGGPEAQIDHEPAPPSLDTDIIVTYNNTIHSM